MPLFFDTNVPVGYIFKWDPWHTFANNAFKTKDSKYWSETVENETNYKLNKLKRKYSELLLCICHKLKHSEGFFKKDDIIKWVNSFKINNLKHKKRVLVIESIWATEGFGYEESCDKILNSFSRIKMDFDSDVYSRKKKFSSNVHLHKRMKRYSKIKKELEEKIHQPDLDIFLDAHDLCFIHNDLEFITSDYNPENIAYVKSKTRIHEIIDLESFVFSS